MYYSKITNLFVCTPFKIPFSWITLSGKASKYILKTAGEKLQQQIFHRLKKKRSKKCNQFATDCCLVTLADSLFYCLCYQNTLARNTKCSILKHITRGHFLHEGSSWPGFRSFTLWWMHDQLHLMFQLNGLKFLVCYL